MTTTTSIFHHVENAMHPEEEGDEIDSNSVVNQQQPQETNDSSSSLTSTSSSSPLSELLLARDALQQQMYQLKSKYPTSEADFLVAARARAAHRVESVNSQAKDEDWMQASKVCKEQLGDDDDWEASLSSSSSWKDSLILLMADPNTLKKDGEDDGPPKEPKLLLF